MSWLVNLSITWSTIAGDTKCVVFSSLKLPCINNEVKRIRYEHMLEVQKLSIVVCLDITRDDVSSRVPRFSVPTIYFSKVFSVIVLEFTGERRSPLPCLPPPREDRCLHTFQYHNTRTHACNACACVCTVTRVCVTLPRKHGCRPLSEGAFNPLLQYYSTNTFMAWTYRHIVRVCIHGASVRMGI